MRLRAVILFIAFTAVGYIAKAQYTSNLGRFEVDNIQGCAPFTVNLTPVTVPCDGSSPCDMDYEGNDQFLLNNFTHTYTQPGTYTLRLLAQATTGFDQITITVLENIPPEFDIYTCGGNEVQVKITDTNYDEYLVDFNSDGTPEATIASGNTSNFAYGSSGNKTITVRGRNNNSADNCNATSKVVNALATLPAPTINQLTVLDNARIQLDFASLPNIVYKLQIATNSTTFQPMQDLYNTSTVILNNLRPEDNYYCFRLGAYDPCNNVTNYSNTICSSNFDLNVQNNLNRLTWSTTTTGIADFTITKSSATPTPVSNTSNAFDDTDINCGTNYCYQLISNYSNGSTSTSLQKCGTAISNDIPTAVQNVTTVVGDGVTLSWPQDPNFTVAGYSILKSANGSFTPHGTSTTPSYQDPGYVTESEACYKIQYSDVCGNQSPQSIEVCPIRLTGALQSDNSVDLAWTAYNGWTNGVNRYVIEKYNGQGQLLETIETGTATSLADDSEDLTNQVYVYRIVAYANDPGLDPSVSNAITIIKEPNLFYPTAFTPNGDGLNDTFLVFSQYTAAFEMKIFNRWGEMMFITDDLGQGWDGTYKGSRMPEGTYVFVAKITDLSGRVFDRSGTVVLLKK